MQQLTTLGHKNTINNVRAIRTETLILEFCLLKNKPPSPLSHYVLWFAGIQFAPNLRENVKSPNESKVGEIEDLQPIKFDQEFKKLVKNHNELIDNEKLSQMVDKIIDERMQSFKQAWSEQKDEELIKLKTEIDSKYVALEGTMTNNQKQFDERLANIENKNLDVDLKSLEVKVEDKCRELVKNEIEVSEKKINSNRKNEMEVYMTEFRHESFLEVFSQKICPAGFSISSSYILSTDSKTVLS